MKTNNKFPKWLFRIIFLCLGAALLLPLFGLTIWILHMLEDYSKKMSLFNLIINTNGENIPDGLMYDNKLKTVNFPYNIDHYSQDLSNCKYGKAEVYSYDITYDNETFNSIKDPKNFFKTINKAVKASNYTYHTSILKDMFFKNIVQNKNKIEKDSQDNPKMMNFHNILNWLKKDKNISFNFKRKNESQEVLFFREKTDTDYYFFTVNQFKNLKKFIKKNIPNAQEQSYMDFFILILLFGGLFYPFCIFLKSAMLNPKIFGIKVSSINIDLPNTDPKLNKSFLRAILKNLHYHYKTFLKLVFIQQHEKKTLFFRYLLVFVAFFGISCLTYFLTSITFYNHQMIKDFERKGRIFQPFYFKYYSNEQIVKNLEPELTSSKKKIKYHINHATKEIVKTKKEINKLESSVQTKDNTYDIYLKKSKLTELDLELKISNFVLKIFDEIMQLYEDKKYDDIYHKLLDVQPGLERQFKGFAGDLTNMYISDLLKSYKLRSDDIKEMFKNDSLITFFFSFPCNVTFSLKEKLLYTIYLFLFFLLSFFLCYYFNLYFNQKNIDQGIKILYRNLIYSILEKEVIDYQKKINLKPFLLSYAVLTFIGISLIKFYLIWKVNSYSLEKVDYMVVFKNIILQYIIFLLLFGLGFLIVWQKFLQQLFGQLIRSKARKNSLKKFSEAIDLNLLTKEYTSSPFHPNAYDFNNAFVICNLPFASYVLSPYSQEKYQKKQEIMKEIYNNAQGSFFIEKTLFLINGPSGSGKSTLYGLDFYLQGEKKDGTKEFDLFSIGDEKANYINIHQALNRQNPCWVTIMNDLFADIADEILDNNSLLSDFFDYLEEYCYLTSINIPSKTLSDVISLSGGEKERMYPSAATFLTYLSKIYGLIPWDKITIQLGDECEQGVPENQLQISWTAAQLIEHQILAKLMREYPKKFHSLKNNFKTLLIYVSHAPKMHLKVTRNYLENMKKMKVKLDNFYNKKIMTLKRELSKNITNLKIKFKNNNQKALKEKILLLEQECNIQIQKYNNRKKDLQNNKIIDILSTKFIEINADSDTFLLEAVKKAIKTNPMVMKLLNKGEINLNSINSMTKNNLKIQGEELFYICPQTQKDKKVTFVKFKPGVFDKRTNADYIEVINKRNEEKKKNVQREAEERKKRNQMINNELDTISVTAVDNFPTKNNREEIEQQNREKMLYEAAYERALKNSGGDKSSDGPKSSDGSKSTSSQKTIKKQFTQRRGASTGRKHTKRTFQNSGGPKSTSSQETVKK